MPVMKCHAAIARGVADLGVDVIFGVMGDANLWVIETYVHTCGKRYVAAASEGGAVLMAGGYASRSGLLAVATTTHGPAVSNTVTALAHLARARTPMVLVAGDTDAEDKHNLQNLPHRDLVIPTGAGFEQVRSASTAMADLETAARRALAERRPVVLNLPSGFQQADTAYRTLAPAEIADTSTSPATAAIEEAVAIIASSDRPIIIAGKGAAGPAARSALIELASRIGAGLATTLKGKDLFRDEPVNLGICGNLGNESGMAIIAASDCIIAFGAGLHELTTDRGELLVSKRVIHCDIDVQSIGRFSPVDVGIVGDASQVAQALVGLLDEIEYVTPQRRHVDITARMSRSAPAISTHHRPGTVDLHEFLTSLEIAVPQERNLVFDAGRFMFESLKILTCPEPTAYVHTGDIGSIGLGMGAAIGAATARPDLPTLLVTGDGGFMLGGLAEFNTAVRQGLDLTVAIVNDGAYGAEHIQFTARAMDPGLALFDWPDFASVAQALGGAGLTICSAEGLRTLSSDLAHSARPLIIDVRVDPEHIPMTWRHS